LKVALDTNVLVSAVATRGLCADLLAVILAEHDLVLGETVLTELGQVLARKVGLPKGTIRELEAFLRAQARVVSAAGAVAHGRLDAADARVVAEAVAGGADVRVTGDREMPSVSEAALAVVSPRGLWEQLRSGPRGPGRAT
jgi:putative PIN family toxin of toxin-antitoxin system